MSLNSNKRKIRTNINNKLGRSKGGFDKSMATFDGVYSNSRLMHAAASLVGCIVQIQVRNGNFYEGIFRTFSHQLDLVLEMTHKVSQNSIPVKEAGPAISSLLVSFPFEEGIAEKLIFRLKDVVMLKASNVDLDYATKDNFTDTGISKYNGQISERELEPWEGPSVDLESVSGLVGEDSDGANGWDANDMFKTNAEKYGVKSSYDNSLQEYTVPLSKKNTDEYKKQEAKAMKIAQEIEANTSYQSRIQLENGDEEERFSAVSRSDNGNSNRYVPPQKRRPTPTPKRPVSLSTSSSSSVLLSGQKPYPPQQTVSTLNTSPNQSYRTSNVQNTVSSSNKQSLSPTNQLSNLNPLCAAIGPTAAQLPNSTMQKDVERIVDGEDEDKDSGATVTSCTAVSDYVPPVVDSTKTPVLCTTVPQPLPQRLDKRREIEKKPSKQKGRDDEIEEFKKFSSNFKLSEESRECKEQKDDLHLNIDQKIDPNILASKIADHLKMTEKADVPEEEETTIDIVKSSTLNPNAKEFVLNPNAKSFTPRSLPVSSPQAAMPMQPQRMHAQSPVMAMHHSQMMQGMGQPIFTAMAAPQYLMQATPVSMALSSPFTAASFSQAPRLRKEIQLGSLYSTSSLSCSQAPRFRCIVPLMQPRHDMSQSVHVAAATGQPILAPNPMPTPSQLTMQYTPPPGMIHAPGPPQQAMTYPQMSYVVGPRVMSPQAVGMVPTSHAVSYCDNAHLPAHLIMSAHPGAAGLSAVSAAHSIQQGVSGQHSNPHSVQTHNIHPAPSPVHQPPPPQHVAPSQPSTPTTVMYPGPVNQHQLQSGHPNANQQMTQHLTHPHHANFPSGPQPVVLMQQQAVPGSHSHPNSIPTGPHPFHLHSIHSQNAGNHVGTPTHVVPQMTVIPTSAALVSASTTMASSPFIPHPQGV